jgi:formyl-CoA transferase
MGPLDGVRVLEAGLLIQGPQAALTMQEWGADVVKIELPGFGDQSRWLPLARKDRRSAFFAAYNRGKRSITIDLRVPKGREVFLRLVEQARRSGRSGLMRRAKGPTSAARPEAA